MTKRVLPDYPCPSCNGKIRNVAVEEQAIKTAPRVPVLITAKCEKGHQVILFVDRNLQIREAEPAAPDATQKKSAIDKASNWFGHVS